MNHFRSRLSGVSRSDCQDKTTHATGRVGVKQVVVELRQARRVPSRFWATRRGGEIGGVGRLLWAEYQKSICIASKDTSGSRNSPLRTAQLHLSLSKGLGGISVAMVTAARVAVALAVLTSRGHADTASTVRFASLCKPVLV